MFSNYLWKKMKKFIKYLPIILAAAISIYLGYYLGNAVSDNPILIFTAAVALLISVFLQIILHELGHLVAGLLSGYSFHSFNVMGFVLLIEDNKPKIKRQRLAGIGGQCIMQPPLIKDQDIPFTIYLASGVAFNVLFSLASALLLFVGDAGLNVAVVVFCAVGLYFTATNGIPLGKKDIVNDFDNLLSLKRNPDLVRYFFVQLTVANLAQSERLKNMPPDLFELPQSHLNNEILASSVAMFRFNMLIDSMRFTEARELGARLCEEYSLASLHKFILFNDLVFLELIAENREDELNKLNLSIDKGIKKAMIEYPSVLRTDYVFELLHNKNPEKAQEVLSRFEKVALSYALKTDIESERELIGYARNLVQP